MFTQIVSCQHLYWQLFISVFSLCSSLEDIYVSGTFNDDFTLDMVIGKCLFNLESPPIGGIVEYILPNQIFINLC